MKEISVLEVLFRHREAYGHILQQVFLFLDPKSLRNIRLASVELRRFVDKRIWKSSRSREILHRRLMRSWLGCGEIPVEESAFQCSDDVYDMKIRGDSIICGLRNGTIEIWNRKTLKKEMSLEEQHGQVQVDADEHVVVGVSSDSTVCVWDRQRGNLLDVFYHHRASVWGVRIRGGFIITGSMDGTISLISIESLAVIKHFLAHEDEWGVSDVDTTPAEIISGCFGGKIRAWSLSDCSLRISIDAGHAVNCVSAHGDLVVSSSRTGKHDNGVANVIVWSLKNGDPIRKLDLPSSCYVQLDCDKLITLVAAGDAIIGEHHMVKWPIAKIVVLPRPEGDVKDLATWDWPKNKYEILLRYMRTPAVTCNRTILVYSQPRTRGMCSVVEHWPAT